MHQLAHTYIYRIMLYYIILMAIGESGVCHDEPGFVQCSGVSIIDKISHSCLQALSRYYQYYCTVYIRVCMIYNSVK